jgi:hypothetical protein
MIPQFSEMLDEIATAGITVDPDGGTEPNANLCTISVSGAQAVNMSPDDVISFLYRAADCFDAHRQSVSPDHSMLFYSWVDDMAGRLRLSVVSSLPLPFGCATRVVRDPAVIAGNLLGCLSLDGIPFSELETDDGRCVDPEPHVLDVCVIDLPRSHALP